ncbi:MAG: RNA polymerase sigma factor [Polyangiaceae bacterium]|nr:RNA polymerase sigma factor [Polyangiaceae bacterium]
MLATTISTLLDRSDSPPGQGRGKAAVGHRLGVSDDDEELVDRLVRGDVWAKEALYRRYFGQIWHLALRLLAHREDAEDVVQDTFVHAFEEVADLRDRTRFGHWLTRITVHQVHRRFRRRKLHRLLGWTQYDEDATLDLLVRSGTDPERAVELRRIAGVLQQLPTRQRIAWVLRHVEGFSLDETAGLAQASIATVKRDLVAAQARIQRALAQRGVR